MSFTRVGVTSPVRADGHVTPLTPGNDGVGAVDGGRGRRNLSVPYGI